MKHRSKTWFWSIDTVDTMNNVRAALYNDHIDVAGNILKVSLVSQWDEIKSSFIWYDSHIILRPLWMHEYRFDVLEKDWSFSNMCGNGAVAAQIFLDKSLLKFITKTWDSVHVIRKDSSIEVQFPKISNQTLSDSSQIISQIQEMSQAEIVSKLWIQDGSNTNIYLRSLLVNSIWSWIWTNFLSTLSLKDIYFSAWEPHLLLEIAWDLSPKNRDACLKILTPLLRFFLKEMGIYHEDVNVMAYIWNEHDDHIKLFPSERWVSHEYNQDQTGACGTWCVCTCFIFVWINW
jgi:diaminopimelate epimerase